MYNQLIIRPGNDPTLNSFVREVTKAINELGDRFVSVNYIPFGFIDDTYAIILYKEENV